MSHCCCNTSNNNNNEVIYFQTASYSYTNSCECIYTYCEYTYTFSLRFVGITGYPQHLKIIRRDSRLRTVQLGWDELQYDRYNGALIGYDCTTYYDKFAATKRVHFYETAFTVSFPKEPGSPSPRAFSVAAVNEVGVGDHCPPVNITDFG